MNWSFQLYSARNFQPWDKVLKMLARSRLHAGRRLRRRLCRPGRIPQASSTRNGLTMPSGHFSHRPAGERFRRRGARSPRRSASSMIDLPAHRRGARPTDAAGWQAFGKRLGKVGEKAKKAGFDFAWHNHDFEFKALADGSLPQEHHARRGARHRLGDGRRLGDPRRRRSVAMDRPNTARASPPSTSRTSRRPARTPTRTAGPMSATAPSTGPA